MLDDLEAHALTMPPLLRARARILLVEGDEALRSVIAGRLLRDGFHVYQASSAAEALDALAALSGEDDLGAAVDLLVFDVSVDDHSAIEVVRELRAAGCELPVLFLSTFPDHVVSRSATELTAFVLSKPFSLDGLAETALDVIDGARVHELLS